jgi:hypothetical protein
MDQPQAKYDEEMKPVKLALLRRLARRFRAPKDA